MEEIEILINKNKTRYEIEIPLEYQEEFETILRYWQEELIDWKIKFKINE